MVTGDTVTVTPAPDGGPGTLTVQGPDGEPTGARVLTVGGDTHVYPDAARPTWRPARWTTSSSTSHG
ncbi:hypothetical protein [Streptomyces sp. NPDC005423]|uniref:hypothetical protein n=1 Tax=Streptomyces sp. NPDC005423 TaxID=3155343 RepID=UPI0033A8DEEF